MSLTRSSWQIETINGVPWEVEKELMFRRLPQEDPNKIVEEFGMGGTSGKGGPEEPASQLLCKPSLYSQLNLIPQHGLVLPTFPYLTFKPFLQASFLRHTAKSQGFPTLSSQRHTIPGSVCYLHSL